MTLEKRECEAPYHVEGCSGYGETIDHHTPRCIARKILHWKKKQIDAPENIQYLSKACHREKDRTTCERFRLAKKVLTAEVTQEEYLEAIK